MTMIGQPTNTVEGVTLRHLYILGASKLECELVAGDSRCEAPLTVEATTNARGDNGQIDCSLGGIRPVINIARSGEMATGFNSGGTLRKTLAQYATRFSEHYGINDFNNSISLANLIIAKKNIWHLFRDTYGLRGKISTLTPDSRPSNLVAGAVNTNVAGYNALVRDPTNYVMDGIDGYYELSDVVATARDSGLWKTIALGFPDNLSTDWLHQNAAGSAVIEASGAVN